MNTYVFNVTIEAKLDSTDDMEPGSTPTTINRKEVLSQIIDFPNELRIGDTLMLASEDSPMKDRVADLYHCLSLGHTQIILEPKEVRGSQEKKVKEDFNALISRYMDAFNKVYFNSRR